MKHLTPWLIAGALLLTFGLVHATRAQDGEGQPTTAPAASKEDTVRRFLKASGQDQMGARARDMMVAELKASEGVPPGFIKVFIKEAKPEELTERLVAIYAEALDAETLAAAIAFYETAAGKKLAAATATTEPKILQAQQEWSQSAAQRAMKAMGLGDPMEQLKEARRHGNEAAAIGALKTISTSQSLFREGDKDNDQQLDYAAALKELGDVGLIDAVLASGTKQGYVFEMCVGSEAPEFLWMATARPEEPGVTGDRWFATNHEGVTYYRTDGPFTLDKAKAQVKDGTPVGR